MNPRLCFSPTGHCGFPEERHYSRCVRGERRGTVPATGWVQQTLYLHNQRRVMINTTLGTGTYQK